MKLIKLYATWCKPCVELSEMLNEHNIQHESIDLDSLDGEGMVSKYSIKALPTLLKFDDDNNLLNTLVGCPGTKEELIKFIYASN